MPNIALLAPVPYEHLESGKPICDKEGKVAFGSMAWEVFRELDKERNGASVNVYIYASDSPNSEELEVSWIGRYIGHVESKNGTHPDGMRFRPPSTAKNPGDNKGHWAVFWELDELRELEPSECKPTGAFTGYKSKKQYKKNVVPRGPLLINQV